MAALGPLIQLALQLAATDVASVGGAVLMVHLAIRAGIWWRSIR